MGSRSANLEKERERAKKPGAGYPIIMPPKDPIVEKTDTFHKEMKKHPAQRKKKAWV